MDSRPFVSIILPTRNRAHLLRGAIVGILQQTYPHFELIIVDDGSTDNTSELIEEIKKETVDPRITLIRFQKHEGQAQARNAALRAAQGVFIAFQDDDDEWSPRYLERQVASLQSSSEEYGMSYVSYWRILPSGKKVLLPPRSFQPKSGYIYGGDIMKKNYCPLQGSMIKKTTLNELGDFNEQMKSLFDWEMWLRIARRYKIAHIDEPLFTLRYTPKSNSSDQKKIWWRIEGRKCILKTFEDDIKKFGYFPDHVSALANLLMEAGDPSQARHYLKRGMQCTPLSIKLFLHFGATYLGKKSYWYLKNFYLFASKRRKEVLLLIFTSLLSLIFLEMSVRILNIGDRPETYGYPPGLFLPNETKGFIYKPNFKGAFPHSSYNHIPIEINSKGLRDYEHEYKNLMGAIRILGLGDSVTFGSGVFQDDTYLKQLERKLTNAGYPVEIINAGMNKYEFDQEYTYFREEGFKYDPDIVILGLVLNDIKTVTAQDIENMKHKYKNLLEYGATKTTREASLIDRITKFCELCDVLNMLRVDRYNLRYFTESIEKRWEKDWPSFQEKLVHFNNVLKESNIKLLIVVFPQKEQLTHAYNLTKSPQQKLKAMGLTHRIEVIDLLHSLDMPTYENLYLKGDGVHLNKSGYEIVSDVISQKLIEDFLISP